MPQVLDDLQDAVNSISDAADAAVVLINGIAGRIEAAVAAAIANGATEQQLAPVTGEVATLRAKAKALGDAVAANTGA